MVVLNAYPLFLAALVSQALATPLDTSSVIQIDEESGLLILRQYTTNDGYIITIYGDDPSSAPAVPADVPTIQRRCGSNQIQCYTDNLAPRGTCQYLWSWMVDADNEHPGETLITEGPHRSVCVQTEDLSARCCTSWADDVGFGFDANAVLVPGIEDIFLRCAGADGAVSGKMADVSLNGGCTTQCLSNRPDGCKA